ncbi:MAG: VanZ family protein [Candidatus Manganitrophus sp. SA1]|nr:VanZ family protein [Candidatus Manganitrophus morganii]
MSRWIGVAVYTLLLYATLPFGRPLLNLVKGVLGASFSLSVNLILAGIALTLLASFKPKQTLSFRGRPVFIFAGVALTLLVSPIAMPEERIHLIQYAVLGYLAARAAQTRRRAGGPPSNPSQVSDLFLVRENRPIFLPRTSRWGEVFHGGVGLAFGLVFVVGVGDEVIQWLLPSRIFDLRDIFFNCIGGIAGILLQAGTHPRSLSS